MHALNKRQKKNLYKIIIALILYILLVIIEKVYQLDSLVLFLLFLIPYFVVGSHVVKKALLGIKNRQMFDESFLMTIATVGAFATGENAEAVAVMLFYQIGEWFQDYAVNKSRKSISDLMDIVPEYANVVRDDKVEVVDPDDVEVGETIIVKPGERIPLDGIVINGDSMINTSALTGESVPRHVQIDDEVISGCINGEGLLKIKTLKLYDDSTVAKILELVEEAAEKKSKTENFITRFARYYTPVVVISALILAIIPSMITRDPMTWIYRACTFLVISCPCALVISVPLAFFGGIGSASSQGILVKGSNYLELMNDVKIIVSDKTGTLTEGVFKVTKMIPHDTTEEILLETAAIAETYSTHPIALSIKEAYGKDLPKDVEVTNIAGSGVKAIYQDKTIYVGNKRLMKELGVDDIPEGVGSVVYVYQDKYLGMITISDKIKLEAKESIEKMKHQGIEDVIMLTGDKDDVARDVSKELGLTQYYSELLPGDKVSKVEDILSQNKKTAFIGDGVNDAPVLSRVDVGIAMGSMGSDAAIEAADIVIMDDSLLKIPIVMKIAHKTVSISKQNIVFALAVKIAVLLLGALGIANMWAAVFADVGVAFLCIINAMRTLKVD